jgi:hypothetical protein
MQATPQYSKTTEMAAIARVIPLRRAATHEPRADLDLGSEASHE